MPILPKVKIGDKVRFLEILRTSDWGAVHKEGEYVVTVVYYGKYDSFEFYDDLGRISFASAVSDVWELV